MLSKLFNKNKNSVTFFYNFVISVYYIHCIWSVVDEHRTVMVIIVTLFIVVSCDIICVRFYALQSFGSSVTTQPSDLSCTLLSFPTLNKFVIYCIPETRSDNDRSCWIAPVFYSHWSDPTLYVLERSYGNRNTI